MSERKITISGNLRDHLSIESMQTKGTIVIFGASGDLTKRKLIPAIFALYQRNLLPEEFAVVGIARTKMSNEEFRTEVKNSIAKQVKEEDNIEEFIARFTYIAGVYDDANTYEQINKELTRHSEVYNTNANAVFYMATPPQLFLVIAKGLHEGGLLAEENSWRRLIIEKPFGRDLETAIALDKNLKKYLSESQIYRIDHYLGKETVQNILMLRFANAIFEPLWNSRYIDRVEITVAEELGIGTRAGYYDQAGALRDMFQNHMMQMLSLIAMEPPATFSADEYRDEIVKLIKSLRPLKEEDLDKISVRGQYATNEEKGLFGYKQEPKIPQDSKTETYVALQLNIENWRWQGVPFYMRTGKRMPQKKSEIAIFFKQIPHSIFKPIKPEDFCANVLVLRMQPHEGMSLGLEVKSPGSKLGVNTLEMSFSYTDFIKDSIPDAYERLLLDALQGDQTLFVRNDAVEASWEFFKPLMDAWSKDSEKTPICYYKAGTDGPKEADNILKGSVKGWRKL